LHDNPHKIYVEFTAHRPSIEEEISKKVGYLRAGILKFVLKMKKIVI
jgi:hypothetical protein